MVGNMKAVELINRRLPIAEAAFAHIVIWQLPAPVPGCSHLYKYRLAYVVNEVCVLRYDNERGKGDHKHHGGTEIPFDFAGVDALLLDFLNAIARWNDENGIA